MPHRRISQQPIKQKDLQSKTFDDFIPALSIPRNLASFIAWNSHKQDFLVKSLYEAIERYAVYREQQAKHAGFIEGCEAQKFVCAEHAKISKVEENPDGSFNVGVKKVSKGSIIKAPNAQSPYEPEENP